MSSYMYNPSKIVSELLSEYLEFDEDQLKLGIWSGHLSLQNVHLRQEAVYPLLNHHATKWSRGSGDDSSKPPLRFKLLSGTIGSFNIDIPWKRLVLADGDVKVDIRNVALVLGLESREETYERYRKQRRSTSDVADTDQEGGFVSYLDAFEHQEEDNPDKRMDRLRQHRQRKQNRLREAEKRLLQGLPLGPWLSTMNRRDEERARRKTAEKTEAPAEIESRLQKWLRGAKNDFLQRLIVGLKINIENIKLVIVQDRIEVGAIIPSIRVGEFESTPLDAQVAKSIPDSVIDGTGTPPDHNFEEGDMDDGARFEKRIKMTGLGIYTRRKTGSDSSSAYVPIDISTIEYILRPVSLEMNFSIFYPESIDKRKKRHRTSMPDAFSSKQGRSNNGNSSVESAKHVRRSKRDKKAVTESTTAFLTEPTSPSSHRTIHAMGLSSIPRPASPTRISRSLGLKSSGQPKRRSQLGVVDQMDRQLSRRVRSMTRPLARPDDVASAFASSYKSSSTETAASFSGDLSIGAIELVCSARHFDLISNFAANCTKIRNGRPSKRIYSVIDHENAMKQSLAMIDTADNTDLSERLSGSVPVPPAGNQSVRLRLQLQNTGVDRSNVIKSWWRYSISAVLWELRHRRRIRRLFQERFLFFNWDKLRYKRQEYVDLFIDRIKKDCNADLVRFPDEKLLAIEDELPIEQILLYRSIARDVHVRGGTKMTTSVHEFRAKLDPIPNPVGSEQKKQDHSDRSASGSHDKPTKDQASTLLLLVESQCEIARRRRSPLFERGMESFRPFESCTKVAVAGDVSVDKDESTFVTFQTRQTMGNTLVDSLKTSAPKSVSLLYSFSIKLEKVEIMIVEETMSDGYAALASSTSVDLKKPLGLDDIPMDDISILTDDQRFFKEVPVNLDEENVDVDPIVPSTDYLLFRLPDKVLLRLTTSPLQLSLVGRSGGHLNCNFSLSRVCATSENDNSILEIGGEDFADNPPEVVGVTRRIPDGNSFRPPHEALAVSYVAGNRVNILQCDAARIRAILDLESITKLTHFCSQVSVFYPTNLVHRSAKEDIRFHLLNRNSNSTLSTWNASIRLHGFDVFLPISSQNGSSEGEMSSFGPHLQTSLIEVYSGSAVDAVQFEPLKKGVGSQSESRIPDWDEATTRALQLLDVAAIVSTNSPLCHNWVFAISGLDLLLNSVTTDNRLSFLEVPIDLEALVSLNSDVAVDFGRAKVESIVEVSPINLVLSESRLQIIMQAYAEVKQAFMSHQHYHSELEKELAPRLEVLSRHIVAVVDVNVANIRLTFKASNESKVEISKQSIVEDSIYKFLRVVALFDIICPHEEALFSAMQICIDRLCGLGIPQDDAWQIANSALMTFLDDVGSSQDATLTHDLQTTTDPIELYAEAKKKSVQQATSTYNAFYVFRELDSEGLSTNDFIVDLPDRLRCSVVQLFYDQYMQADIPTILVTNGSGMHLLRITRPRRTQMIVDPMDAGSSSMSEDVQDGVSASTVASETAGVGIRRFVVDIEHPLGRGGVPLTVLSSDSDDYSACKTRAREKLEDIQLGDVEVLCTYELWSDAIGTLSSIFVPFESSTNAHCTNTHSVVQTNSMPTTAQSHFLLTGESASSLFASDSLEPFCRLEAAELIVRVHMASISNVSPLQSLTTAKSLSLLNLTPEGQIHQMILSVLPADQDATLAPTGEAVSLKYWLNGVEPNADLSLHGFRVVFLQSFVSEALQFFSSPDYGVGLLLHSFKSSKSTSVDAPNLKFKVSVFESSVLIPIKSLSSEMIAIELSQFSLESGSVDKNFIMPSRSTPIVIPDVILRESLSVDGFEDCLSETLDPADNNGLDSGPRQPVQRIIVCLKRFQIFVAASHDKEAAEQLSFEYIYSIDGRAAADKLVYRLREIVDESAEPTRDSFAKAEKAQRRWREITAELSSIDIVVELTPHLRVLIVDPLDGSPGSVRLETKLSEFCLLLSIWFVNMQELPRMFPFSISQILSKSVNPWSRVSIPEFGTLDFKNMLQSASELTSEVAVVLSTVSLRCIIDEEDGSSDRTTAICLALENLALHVTVDQFGVSRIGAGSRAVFLTDEKRIFQKTLICEDRRSERHSWADLNFGLDSDRSLLTSGLDNAFQLSVFLVREWTHCNVGLCNAAITLSNLEPIFELLQFFTAYFSNPDHGNPSFDAISEAKRTKHELHDPGTAYEDRNDGNSNGIEFRLWLSSPCLAIPCNPLSLSTSCLRVYGPSGLWYKYLSMDRFSSQEFVCESLSLVHDDEYRIICDIEESNSAGRTLISNISFGLRLDFNQETNHSDVSFVMPFLDSRPCRFTSPRISVPPIFIDVPTVCTPTKTLGRRLGPHVCEFTCLVDVLSDVSLAISNFAGNSGNDLDNYTDSEHSDTEEKGSSDTEEKGSFSASASISDLRFFFLDPVLGPHLPIAVVSVSSFQVSASQFDLGDLRLISTAPNKSPAEDLQMIVKGHFWADYFKLGLTRSWEPLVEPFEFTALFERSKFRGTGLSFSSGSSFHINISGALLVIADQVADLYGRLTKHLIGKFDASTNVKVRDIVSGDVFVEDDYCSEAPVHHEKPRNLRIDDRVAFSLRNMTGQCFRVVQSGMTARNEASAPRIVTYLGHDRAMSLSFTPSISTIRDLELVDVNYPGLATSDANVAPHTACIQLPGFRFLYGIKVDTFGRSFASISPRSDELRAKAEQDWRIENVMKLLVEVGLENGGRQVTIRSLFSVVNRTSHSVRVLLHPDPIFEPNGSDNIFHYGSRRTSPAADVVVEPQGSFQVPVLLVESALCLPGSQIGSFWVKPTLESSNSSALESFLQGRDIDHDITVDYSSRAIQMSKLVNDSATIFTNARGNDVSPDAAKSGVEVSCPVKLSSGDRLAPFCYVVEVCRSPLVKSWADSGNDVRKKPKFAHGPVSYSLSIHPPLVVVNLHPHRGLFELMHAVRRTVLWHADLDPGQEVAIHSVGLDAPLLLLLNLGFCRTPVGEGALVHHGTDIPVGVRENLSGFKSIGKAGKAVTKKIGKTLTALSESPDKRGKLKLFQAQNPQFRSEKAEQTNLDAFKLGVKTELDDIEKAGGTTYRVEASVFLPGDVAEETMVVDSVGQRLKLNIENARAGGGQRRISVYCPFWIVNTTEHALRFKQDNSKAFVSGTVHSPNLDGSLPLSATGAMASRSEKGTAFSGLPGALASSPGRCQLTSDDIMHLIDENLSLEKSAALAFMFNFHEGATLGITQQRLCVQLWDGTGTTSYQSDWSRGISLDSVGISQVIGMHCKEGRFLECTVLITVAPGFLSNYTKIVRLLPRYVLVNTLTHPVRLWQDSSVFRAEWSSQLLSGKPSWHYNGDRQRTKLDNIVNQYEALWGRETVLDKENPSMIHPVSNADRTAFYTATVLPSQIFPFSLPDSRADRQLRIDFGWPWKLTSSFASDIAGEHMLAINREIDLRLLSHISTRASPEYQVTVEMGMDGVTEFGVWFETDWGGGKNMIVKAVKKNSYAFNETDIHRGDELLQIDDQLVARMTFSETIGLLRQRITNVAAAKPQDSRRAIRRASLMLIGRSAAATPANQPIEARPLVLRFRTVEERLRRVRAKAATAKTAASSRDWFSSMKSTFQDSPELPTCSDGNPMVFLKAELKTLHHMMFIVLRDHQEAPFEIRNRTVDSVMYYRQRGCTIWNQLEPGQTKSYAWEEPLRAKRLSVRFARSAFKFTSDTLPEGESDRTSLDLGPPSRPGVKSSKVAIADEEDLIFSPCVIVRLEEIGFVEWVTTLTHGRNLELEVVVAGPTRVLVVRDVTTMAGDSLITRHLEFLVKRITDEELRLRTITDLSRRATQASLQYERDDDGARQSAYALVDEAKALMTDSSPDRFILERHQLLVEVLGATGLNPSTLSGECNPYVEVSVKIGTSHMSLFKKTDRRRTYYIRSTADPTWLGQSFVFQIPQDAVTVPRGYAVSLKIRNYRAFGVVGKDKVLGKAQVELFSLRNQQPLEGWFPLAGPSGRPELENQLSHWGRGSVKLRLQWIYSIPALLDYFKSLTEKSLEELRTRDESLTRSLQFKREEDDKEKEALDGFKVVRIEEHATPARRGFMHDSLLSEKHGLKRIIDPLVDRVRTEAHAGLERLTNPLLRRSIRPDSSISSDPPFRLPDESKPDQDMNFGVPPEVGESTIQAQRRTFHKLISTRDTSKANPAVALRKRPVATGEVDVSHFSSWTEAQALLNDRHLKWTVASEKLQAQYLVADEPSTDKSTDELDSENIVMKQYRLPPWMPSTTRKSLKTEATSLVESRSSFERFARVSLGAVLNPGGWLTIRPVMAMNLPDLYTGMLVKIRYGAEVLVSDVADARIAPTWQNTNTKTRSLDSREVSSAEPNDLHVHVPPYKTSGSIRVSVLGERSQQQLLSRVEIGSVQLPLGSLIAACINSVELDDCIGEDCASVDMTYERWFPLTSPKDSVPVEGDHGFSSRPVDTEKQSERDFNDSYQPCLKLLIIWRPDYDEPLENNETQLSLGQTQRLNSSPTVETYFNADIERLSVALIDSERTFELLSCHMIDILARYWVTTSKTRIGLSAGWIQVDNQDEESREAVILAPTPSEYFMPVLQIAAMKNNLRSTDVVSFDFIDVTIAEFDITLEEAVVFDLFGFFESVHLRRSVLKVASAPDAAASTISLSFLNGTPVPATAEQNLVSLLNEQDAGANKIYIEQLSLGVVRVNMSYIKGKRTAWELTSQGAWMDKAGRLRPLHSMAESLGMQQVTSDVFSSWSRGTWKEDRRAEEDIGRALINLPHLIAALFPNVSDAPIRLQGKKINHVFESPSEIVQSIRRFYVTETLRQIYKLVGSLDFVGNPTMLLNSVLSGVRDLLVAPSTAFMNSPTNASGVGLGVAKGALSFLSHSTSGFFGFCANVSAAAGQSVAALSLDADFRNWHRDHVLVAVRNLNRQWKKRGVQSIRAIVTKPIADVLFGVAAGVSGIIVSPVKYYRKEGTTGIAKGVAVGAIGVIARPIVGVLDAFAHFAADIHDVAKSVNVLEKRLQPALRLRLPYTFSLMGVLVPYETPMARACSLLSFFPVNVKKLGMSAILPEAIIHVEVLPIIGADTYAVLTTCRIILIKVKKELSGNLTPSLGWEVQFTDDTVVSSRVSDHGHNGVALTISVCNIRNISESIGKLAYPEESMILTGSLTDMMADEASVAGTTDGTPSALDPDLGDSFKYRKGKGSKGESYEWFTVLAEYQYRRQLSRMHNAISCMMRNFDAIINDASLGRPGSTEGYTSFGPFYFIPGEKAVTTRKTKDQYHTDIAETLENICWVSESIFAACLNKKSNDDNHKPNLREIQMDWDYEKHLQASKEEGGPDWLIEVRARATFTDPNNDGTTQQLSSGWGLDRSIRQGPNGNTHIYLPTIGEDPTEDGTEPVRNSNILYASAQQSLVPYADDEMLPPYNMTRRDTIDSFYTSHGGAYSMHDFHNSQTLSLTEEEDEVDVDHYDNTMIIPLEEGIRPTIPDVVRLTRVEERPTKISSKDSAVSIPLVENSVPSNDTIDGHGVAGDNRGTSSGHNHVGSLERMERMERLMERLLLVTSEHVLRLGASGGEGGGGVSNPVPSSSSISPSMDHDTTLIRQDITELRNMMLTDQRRKVASIQRLKADVAALKALLIQPTPPAQPIPSSLSQNQSSRNTGSIIPPMVHEHNSITRMIATSQQNHQEVPPPSRPVHHHHEDRDDNDDNVSFSNFKDID